MMLLRGPPSFFLSASLVAARGRKEIHFT